MAAVCAGPKFAVADVEALEALDSAELLADDALADAVLLTLASCEDRDEASEPVAVASSELSDEAWLLAEEVMEDSSEERPLLADDRALESTEETEEATLEAEEAALERAPALELVDPCACM